MSELVELINGVGFPIAAFCMMFYVTYRMLNEVSPMLGKIDKTLDHILDYFRENNEKEKDE